MTLADTDPNFRGPGELLQRLWGPDIASATTIAPQYYIQHVTGTTAIQTITPPYTGFVGPLYLVTDSAGSFGTSGNIKKAQTHVAGYVYCLWYDPTEAKWYQQAVA
jgi:hypothetical protein